jgi:hypothetical protein
MHWGVEMARKGGVPADRVLNAMPLTDITRYLRQKRRSLARAAWCRQRRISHWWEKSWPSRPIAVTTSASRHGIRSY